MDLRKQKTPKAKSLITWIYRYFFVDLKTFFCGFKNDIWPIKIFHLCNERHHFTG